MDPQRAALTGAFLAPTLSLGALVRLRQCMVMVSHQALLMVSFH